MDEEGEEFSFFFGSAVFLEYVFFVSVDEDISGFFVFAVAAADDGADLLEGVVGVFLEEEDGSVFDIPVEDSLTVGAEFLVLVLLVEESSAPGAGFVAGGGFAFPDFEDFCHEVLEGLLQFVVSDVAFDPVFNPFFLAFGEVLAVHFLLFFDFMVDGIQSRVGFFLFLPGACDEADVFESFPEFVFGEAFQKVAFHHEEVLEEDGVRDGDDQGVVFPAFDVGFLGEHVADDVLPPFLEEEELEAVISENFLAGEGVGEDLVDAGHDFISFAFVFMVFFHDALLR